MVSKIQAVSICALAALLMGNRPCTPEEEAAELKAVNEIIAEGGYTDIKVGDIEWDALQCRGLNRYRFSGKDGDGRESELPRVSLRLNPWRPATGLRRVV
jgi:hypothetical protein